MKTNDRFHLYLGSRCRYFDDNSYLLHYIYSVTVQFDSVTSSVSVS
jgi:hypothetical protein